MEVAMALVEVFAGQDMDQPLFKADFAFMPRCGDGISRDTEGFFRYYNVVEVWHRQVGENSPVIACVRVEVEE
jgi:hypothetical protein